MLLPNGIIRLECHPLLQQLGSISIRNPGCSELFRRYLRSFCPTKSRHLHRSAKYNHFDTNPSDRDRDCYDRWTDYTHFATSIWASTSDNDQLHSSCDCLWSSHYFDFGRHGPASHFRDQHPTGGSPSYHPRWWATSCGLHAYFCKYRIDPDAPVNATSTAGYIVGLHHYALRHPTYGTTQCICALIADCHRPCSKSCVLHLHWRSFFTTIQYLIGLHSHRWDVCNVFGIDPRRQIGTGILCRLTF